MPEIQIIIINGPHEGLKMKSYPEATEVARHIRLPLQGRSFSDTQGEASRALRDQAWRNELENAALEGKKVLEPSDIDAMVEDVKRQDESIQHLTHAAYVITELDDECENEAGGRGRASYRFLREVPATWHPREELQNAPEDSLLDLPNWDEIDPPPELPGTSNAM